MAPIFKNGPAFNIVADVRFTWEFVTELQSTNIVKFFCSLFAEVCINEQKFWVVTVEKQCRRLPSARNEFFSNWTRFRLHLKTIMQAANNDEVNAVKNDIMSGSPLLEMTHCWPGQSWHVKPGNYIRIFVLSPAAKCKKGVNVKNNWRNDNELFGLARGQVFVWWWDESWL